MGGFPSCANSALTYSSTPPFNVLLIVPDCSLPGILGALLCVEDFVYSYPSPRNVLPPHLLGLATSFSTFQPQTWLSLVNQEPTLDPHPWLHSFDFLGEHTSSKFSGLRSYQLLPRCLSPPVQCKLREGGAPSRSFQY